MNIRSTHLVVGIMSSGRIVFSNQQSLSYSLVGSGVEGSVIGGGVSGSRTGDEGFESGGKGIGSGVCAGSAGSYGDVGGMSGLSSKLCKFLPLLLLIGTLSSLCNLRILCASVVMIS